jgi:hypothetical protein
MDEYLEYRGALMESPAFASAFAAGRRYIKYEQMSEEELRLLLDATSKLAKAWFEAQKKI